LSGERIAQMLGTTDGSGGSACQREERDISGKRLPDDTRCDCQLSKMFLPAHTPIGISRPILLASALAMAISTTNY
jgi:hypothetical protein